MAGPLPSVGHAVLQLEGALPSGSPLSSSGAVSPGLQPRSGSSGHEDPRPSAIGLARQAGAEAMFLEVATDNRPAIALYEGAGFERAGQRKGYYARVGDASGDAYVYRLRLAASAR